MSPGLALTDPVVVAERVSKAFGAVQALQSVTMNLYAGQVTALVGDNGAGKTTLVKVLAGAHSCDEGALLLHGRPVTLRSPSDARSLGIETIYQDLAIAPDLDVVSNLYLCREITRRLWPRGPRVLDRSKMADGAETALRDLEINIPSLKVPMRYLSGGQRQAVAVARGAMWARTVVMLDEPTAALGVTERQHVLDLILRVKRRGLAVLLVSHSLPEVFEVADNIVVLRHSRKVAELRSAATTMDEVVGFMTGSKQ